ncbi:MAG: hypothetical protein WD871_08935 [Xanthobacteraceae bacterium]
MEPKIVKKRDVVFVCGYEISRPEGHHRRFAKELPLFEATWNATAELSPVEVDPKTNVALWRLKTKGPNWQVDTNYYMFWWGDLIAPDFELPDWRRLWVGFGALFDFVFSGAILHYFRSNWRYALFFLYPYVFLALVAVGGFYLSRHLIGDALPLADLIAVLIGIACVFVLLKLPPQPFYVGYLLNDWYFASDLVHRRRKALEERFDGFARELVALCRHSKADEIVLVGHSLGAVQVIDVAARAKRLHPEFAANGPPVRVLTIGSSLLKIGLHPAAKNLREAVHAVASDPHLYWAEFQAISDIVNFYKSNPVTDLDLPPADKPIVQIVRVKHMLKPETYAGLKRDFFRVHRQFVMANEQRYFYDYYMICCGPIPLPLRVTYHDGAVNSFAPDGSFDSAGVEVGNPAGSTPSKKSRSS